MCSTAHWLPWSVTGVVAGVIFGALAAKYLGAKVFVAFTVIVAIATLILYFKVRSNGCFT